MYFIVCPQIVSRLYVLLSRSPMKKLIQNLRDQSSVQDPEKVTRGQFRRGRDPKRRMLATLKTEQTETDGQLQTITIGPNFSTLQGLTRPLKRMILDQNEGNYHSLQNELTPHLNSYLANKFKKYLENKNDRSQSKSSHRSYNSPEIASKVSLNSITNHSHVVCASCSKVSEKAPTHGDSLLINAREKMLRLLQLRKSQERKYRQLSQQIKRSCLKVQKGKRSLPVTMVMGGLKGEGWDKEWKNSFSLQLKRYRTRVMIKSQKQHRNKFIFNGE